MADPIIGNFFGLYFNSRRLALAQSKSVALKTASENVTTDDSYGWEESIPGNHSLEGSVEGLITAHYDNLLQFPEDLSKSIWSKTDGAITVDPDNGDDNFGQKRLNFVDNGAATEQVYQQVTGLTALNPYTFSIWLKGSGTLYLKFNTKTVLVTLTNTLTRYSITDDASATTENVIIEFLGAVRFYACNAMLNQGESALPYKGSTLMAKELMEFEKNKTKLTLRWSTDLDTDKTIECQAYIMGFDLKTKQGSPNQFSCSFKATGTITQQTI